MKSKKYLQTFLWTNLPKLLNSIEMQMFFLNSYCVPIDSLDFSFPSCHLENGDCYRTDTQTLCDWRERERTTEQKHLYCFSSLWKAEYGSWRWRGKSVDIISVKTPDEDEWSSFLHGVCTFIPESETLRTTLNWEGQVDKLEDGAVYHSMDFQQPEELGWQKAWR